MNTLTQAKYNNLNKAEKAVVHEIVSLLHKEGNITALLGVRREKVRRHIMAHGTESAARLVRNIVGCTLPVATCYVERTF